MLGTDKVEIGEVKCGWGLNWMCKNGHMSEALDFMDSIHRDTVVRNTGWLHISSIILKT